MSGGGITTTPPAPPAGAPSTRPAAPGGMGGFGPPMTLEQSELQTKEIMDWAGLTSIEKMRAASTETIYTVGSLYSAVTGKRTRMTAMPIVDGYVSLQSFDAAAVDNKLAQIPYMIGYTLNDMGNMKTTESVMNSGLSCNVGLTVTLTKTKRLSCARISTSESRLLAGILPSTIMLNPLDVPLDSEIEPIESGRGLWL